VSKTPLESHKDLIAWQKAMSLVDIVREVVRAMPRREWMLAGQLLKSTISVPANIAEGYGRSGRGEYLQFLSHASGSLSETETHLFIVQRGRLVPEALVGRAISAATETARVLHGLRRSLKPADKKRARWPSPRAP
jgi:four helix bundle protein